MLAAPGLTPTSPARYLASLGLLSALSQRDPEAPSVWRGGYVGVLSDEPREALVDWLCGAWAPRGVVAPWNATTRAAEAAATAIKRADFARLNPVRRALLAAERVPRHGARGEVVRAARNALPDDAVEWLDAALRVRDDGSCDCSPVLGTGGNAARVDYASHYVQHVARVTSLDADWPRDLSRVALDACLTGQRGRADVDLPAPWGHLDGRGRVNPWEFVLAMEGAASLLSLAATAALAASDDAAPWPSQWTGASMALDSKDVRSARGGLLGTQWSAPMVLSEVRELLRPAVGWREAASARLAWQWVAGRDGQIALPETIRGDLGDVGECRAQADAAQLKALRRADPDRWRAAVLEAARTVSAQGGSKPDVAALLGVGQATLYDWLRADDALREAVDALAWPASGAAGHASRRPADG